MIKCMNCGRNTEKTCGTLLCEDCYELLICKNEDEDEGLD
jgi:NMD protein affecting ribosome stability and mRNA decay